jgi:hypothetical protein
MNRFALTKPPKNHDRICGDLMTMAERELTAFFNAVTELFGSEQAKIAAEDWLHELMAIDDLQINDPQINDLRINDLRINDLQINDLPASPRQWRQLTVKVMARLASRVNVSFEALATG